ncbi:MAG TPA: hypothetical protein VF756_25380 [Thermoanaerobaculia bacterium]
MRVFVGFGYNDRDRWIEEQVFLILRCMGFIVVDGKDMHGEILQPEVESRIEQSDAAIGFFTIREAQGEADFNSHMWVRDEMVYANAKSKPIIPVKEEGARVPDGLLGNRQYIPLRQDDRLACVAELVGALGRRNIRRLKLDPDSDQLRRDLQQWRRTPGFVIQYRTQDERGLESPYRQGRLELVDQGFYLNVSDVPKRAYVEVEGFLNGAPQFSSGWVSADAVQVKVF